MEKTIPCRWFMGCNSQNGFYSLFEQFTQPEEGWRCLLIKGGPGTGKSTLMKQVVKLALTDRYSHDRYTLADKYHLAYMKDGTPEEVFLAQLERCGVEYFDYYWLHSVTGANIENVERIGAFDFLKQKKAEGKTRHIGFSYHDGAELLDRIVAARLAFLGDFRVEVVPAREELVVADEVERLLGSYDTRPMV